MAANVLQNCGRHGALLLRSTLHGDSEFRTRSFVPEANLGNIHRTTLAPELCRYLGASLGPPFSKKGDTFVSEVEEHLARKAPANHKVHHHLLLLLRVAHGCSGRCRARVDGLFAQQLGTSAISSIDSARVTPGHVQQNAVVDFASQSQSFSLANVGCEPRIEFLLPSGSQTFLQRIPLSHSFLERRSQFPNRLCKRP